MSSPSFLPVSTLYSYSSNHSSDRYSVISPGRGCTNAPPNPCSLNSPSIRSISERVTLVFHTHKGAGRNDLGGSFSSALIFANRFSLDSLGEAYPVLHMNVMSRRMAMAVLVNLSVFIGSSL